MLATPLEQRPQWMLDAVQKDLSWWRRYYAWRESVAPPRSATKADRDEDVDHDTSTTPASSGTMSPIGPDERSSVSVYDEDVCEFEMVFSSPKAVFRKCDWADILVRHYQREPDAFIQAQKYVRALFIIARHMPANAYEILENKEALREKTSKALREKGADPFSAGRSVAGRHPGGTAPPPLRARFYLGLKGEQLNFNKVAEAAHQWRKMQEQNSSDASESPLLPQPSSSPDARSSLCCNKVKVC